jgi:hypothetical protein
MLTLSVFRSQRNLQCVIYMHTSYLLFDVNYSIHLLSCASDSRLRLGLADGYTVHLYELALLIHREGRSISSFAKLRQKSPTTCRASFNLALACPLKPIRFGLSLRLSNDCLVNYFAC